MTVLLYERIGATAVLTLNRPEARNALDFELRGALADAVANVRDDDAVRAVVLAAAGGHFCSGGDVKAMSQTESGKRDVFEGRERIRKIHRWFDELIDLEKPVVAAVDGVCFGAGLSLALAADFVLATPRARFCSVFARLGFVPDMGAMYLLPRAIGLAHAKEMVFSARIVDAAESLALGLVHQLVDGDVRAAALALAARFDSAPTGALGLMKSVMNRSFESDRRTIYAHEALAQSLCRESEFHQEAVRRFTAKEVPLYEWPESPRR
jgi:enoyl-CoA hydratase/carnithine racemase